MKSGARTNKKPISRRTKVRWLNRSVQARGGRSHPPGKVPGGATANGGNTVRAPEKNCGVVAQEAGSARLMQQAAHDAQLVTLEDFDGSESW